MSGLYSGVSLKDLDQAKVVQLTSLRLAKAYMQYAALLRLDQITSTQSNLKQPEFQSGFNPDVYFYMTAAWSMVTLAGSVLDIDPYAITINDYFAQSAEDTFQLLLQKTTDLCEQLSNYVEAEVQEKLIELMVLLRTYPYTLPLDAHDYAARDQIIFSHMYHDNVTVISKLRANVEEFYAEEPKKAGKQKISTNGSKKRSRIKTDDNDTSNVKKRKQIEIEESPANTLNEAKALLSLFQNLNLNNPRKPEVVDDEDISETKKCSREAMDLEITNEAKQPKEVIGDPVETDRISLVKLAYTLFQKAFIVLHSELNKKMLKSQSKKTVFSIPPLVPVCLTASRHMIYLVCSLSHIDPSTLEYIYHDAPREELEGKIDQAFLALCSETEIENQDMFNQQIIELVNLLENHAMMLPIKITDLHLPCLAAYLDSTFQILQTILVPLLLAQESVIQKMEVQTNFTEESSPPEDMHTNEITTDSSFFQPAEEKAEKVEMQVTDENELTHDA